MCAVPFLAPGVVDVVVSTNSETVTWGPPSQPNGVIIYYRVIHFVYQRNANTTSPLLNAASTTYDIPGLGK